MTMKLTKKLARLLHEPIGAVGLSVRTINGLEAVDVYTVEDLLHCCPHRAGFCAALRSAAAGGCFCRRAMNDPHFEPTAYLLDVPNFGDKTLQEVRGKLAELGFVNSPEKG